jgi:hypothetical protein
VTLITEVLVTSRGPSVGIPYATDIGVLVTDDCVGVNYIKCWIFAPYFFLLKIPWMILHIPIFESYRYIL